MAKLKTRDTSKLFLKGTKKKFAESPDSTSPVFAEKTPGKPSSKIRFFLTHKKVKEKNLPAVKYKTCSLCAL